MPKEYAVFDQFVLSSMAGRNTARLKAIDMVRSQMEELTREGVVTFTFILTDEGPEMFGEEDLATRVLEVFEEKKLVEVARRIKMSGKALSHRSTRNLDNLDNLDIVQGFKSGAEGGRKRRRSRRGENGKKRKMSTDGVKKNMGLPARNDLTMNKERKKAEKVRVER